MHFSWVKVHQKLLAVTVVFLFAGFWNGKTRNKFVPEINIVRHIYIYTRIKGYKMPKLDFYFSSWELSVFSGSFVVTMHYVYSILHPGYDRSNATFIRMHTNKMNKQYSKNIKTRHFITINV